MLPFWNIWISRGSKLIIMKNNTWESVWKIPIKSFNIKHVSSKTMISKRGIFENWRELVSFDYDFFITKVQNLSLQVGVVILLFKMIVPFLNSKRPWAIPYLTSSNVPKKKGDRQRTSTLPDVTKLFMYQSQEMMREKNEDSYWNRLSYCLSELSHV